MPVRVIINLHQPVYLLYLIGNADFGGTHGKAGHFRTLPAPPGVLLNAHIQFPQRPVLLSEMKVLICLNTVCISVP